MQMPIMAPRYSDNELERIVQQTSAVMPVAYHLSAPARFDKFLQPTFKQLLVRLVSLNIVDSDTLIEFGESLEVPPCLRIGTKGMNDFGQNLSIRSIRLLRRHQGTTRHLSAASCRASPLSSTPSQPCCSSSTIRGSRNGS